MVTEARTVSQPMIKGVTLDLSAEDAAYLRLLTGFKDSCAQVVTGIDSPYRNRVPRSNIAKAVKAIRGAFDRAGFTKGEAKRTLNIG